MGSELNEIFEWEKKFLLWLFLYVSISINPEIVYLFCWMHWFYFINIWKSIGPEPSNASTLFVEDILIYFVILFNELLWFVDICGACVLIMNLSISIWSHFGFLLWNECQFGVDGWKLWCISLFSKYLLSYGFSWFNHCGGC